MKLLLWANSFSWGKFICLMFSTLVSWTKSPDMKVRQALSVFRQCICREVISCNVRGKVEKQISVAGFSVSCGIIVWQGHKYHIHLHFSVPWWNLSTFSAIPPAAASSSNLLLITLQTIPPQSMLLWGSSITDWWIGSFQLQLAISCPWSLTSCPRLPVDLSIMEIHLVKLTL